MKYDYLVYFGLILMAHQPLLVIKAKSIYIYINSFISNNSVRHKYTVSISKDSPIIKNSVKLKYAV